MSYIPPWQPSRLSGDHRTHIKSPEETYLPWRPNNIVCQIQLYRWANSLDFMNQTVISELHGYLFFNFKGITKRDLGTTVVQAVKYNPRKLKGITLNNPSACSTYLIHNVDDLRYGLEWMICTWIHKAKATEDPELISDFLDEMAACDEGDIDRFYLAPLGPWWSFFSERDLNWSWAKTWDKFGYEREDAGTAPRAQARPALRRI